AAAGAAASSSSPASPFKLPMGASLPSSALAGLAAAAGPLPLDLSAPSSYGCVTSAAADACFSAAAMDLDDNKSALLKAITPSAITPAAASAQRSGRKRRPRLTGGMSSST